MIEIKDRVTGPTAIVCCPARALPKEPGSVFLRPTLGTLQPFGVKMLLDPLNTRVVTDQLCDGEDHSASLHHAPILYMSQNVHLWGTSTGAPLSIRYAARYPQRVKSLITYPSFKAGVASRKMFQVFLDITEIFGYEALARFTAWIGCADQNVFSQVGNDIATFEAEAFKKNFSIESLAKTLEVFTQIDLTSDLEKIKVPTLILLGDSGKLGGKTASMIEAIRVFRMHCPQSQVVQITDGGGTYCMIEKPQESAQVVRTFIKSLSER